MTGRFAVYYRTSTDRQDFESQKYAVEAWLEALPADKKPRSVVVFSDQVSGKATSEKKRTGFQALKRAVEAGDVDTVVVFKIDRLSRDKLTLMYLLMDWIKMGRGFISVSQPVFQMGAENPFRLTMLALFAELAHMERETLISRVKAGMDAAKAKGVKFGKEKTVDTPELREKVRHFRAAGFSIREIAERTGASRSLVGKLALEVMPAVH